MGIRVKAIERNVAFSKNTEDAKWMYVMQAEIYGQLNKDKVFAEASKSSGIPKPAIEAAVAAYGEVVKVWATEGHSVPVPGLGTMRFGLRSKAVEKAEDVKSSLIISRHVIFTPSTEIKEELANTAVNITCYDRNGKIVRSVTSDDKDDVEDNNPDQGKDNPDSDTGSKDDNKGNAGSGGSTSGDGGLNLD